MIPNYYEFQNTTKIISGELAISNIPAELKFFNTNSPLLISDEILKKIGTVDKVKDAIHTDNTVTIRAEFTEVPPDSDLAIINKLAKIYKEYNCDSIIAVGGGSVIDTAKGLRMLISQDEEDINKLMGNEILTYGKHIPFIVVPTTAGTGSEVTLVAVIEDKFKNLKMEFISYFLLPDVAILDPQMTMTLPKKATASTGVDALCHAIEAYSCMQNNPISDAYATTAIKLINENIEDAVLSGNNKKTRLAMANASLMAGIAFSNSMVGLVHAIAHSLGAVCHVPHGDAVAIMLPYVLEYNLDVLEDKYAELLPYFVSEEDYISTPKEQRGKRTIEEVKKLLAKLNKIAGLPINLRDGKLEKEELEKIAKVAINDGAIIVNPKAAEEKDIIEILKMAY